MSWSCVYGLLGLNSGAASIVLSEIRSSGDFNCLPTHLNLLHMSAGPWAQTLLYYRFFGIATGFCSLLLFILTQRTSTLFDSRKTGLNVGEAQSLV